MSASLSLIDILFLVTVALLAFNGFSNGAITSLVNLLSIPLGFVVAYLFGPRFTLLLAANGLPATPLIAYIILFFGAVLVLHIVGTVVRGVVQRVPLVGFGDRLLGALIGFVEAWLLWVVLLLVLTLLLSFTGYLLPDDQLGFWAVTVGTNMARATPLLGHDGPFGAIMGMTPFNDVRFGLLGGSIVDSNALLRAYIWHCVAIPILASAFVVVHFWRVRKDGGISGPAPMTLQSEIKDVKKV